jgi:hypothetical protein
MLASARQALDGGKETKMPLYRKRPVVIEAVQWRGPGGHESVQPYRNAAGASEPFECGVCGLSMKRHGRVGTLEGEHRVCPGDWIIKGVANELYPCKPDIFEKTYELVE